MNSQWSSVIDVAGWTLLHFVWQGTLAALALGFALALVPRRWARVRYVVACVALLGMVALPVITASYIARNPGALQGVVSPGGGRCRRHACEWRHAEQRPRATPQSGRRLATVQTRLKASRPVRFGRRYPRRGSRGWWRVGLPGSASVRFALRVDGGRRAGSFETMHSRPTRRGSAPWIASLCGFGSAHPYGSWSPREFRCRS